MRTLMKLYWNGDVEIIDIALVETGILNNYSFIDNAIVVPKVIEYPPEGVRNYFIEKTSTPTYVDQHSGLDVPANEEDRASDFIDVSGWGHVTIRARFTNVYDWGRPWSNVVFYNNSKDILSFPFDNYVGSQGEDVTWEIQLAVDVAFLRVSVNYYDNPITDVKVSVEKGLTTNTKHYLALEDMPEWVIDTGNPISMFKEGMVIKGNLVTSK